MILDKTSMLFRILLTIALLAASGTCETQTDFSRKFKGFLAGSGSIDNTTTRSLIGCSKSCSEHSECRSIFYDPSSRECQRHSLYYEESKIPNRIPATDAVYYERKGAWTCVPKSIPCPDIDYTSFVPYNDCNQTFRLIVDKTLGFHEAKTECKSHGAHLFEILTVEKMNFARQLLLCPTYKDKNFWIDGEYNLTTSRYETSNGVPLPLTEGTYFLQGSPVEHNEDQCIWFDPDQNHRLNDNGCGSSAYMICEKP